MAAATQTSEEQPRRVPLEVYLHCSDWEPDAEYVDGEIEERPMGEYDHAAWQAAIQRWFWAHEKEWNVEAIGELRVKVGPAQFRVPDVTVLDRTLPVQQIITVPPVAVFEILSPEDRFTRLLRKLKEYAAMGIPQIWVVDPEENSFQQFSEGRLLASTVFEESSRGIHFEFREIAALLRR